MRIPKSTSSILLCAFAAAFLPGTGARAELPRYDATPLGMPQGAVNCSGVRMSRNGSWIAGSATLSDGSSQPVVWSGLSPTTIGNLGGNSGVALDVNVAGVVVGQSDGRAFVWREGVITPLAANPNWSSYARGINDENLIVGQSGGWGRFGDQRRAVAWIPPEFSLVDVHSLAGLPNGSFDTGSSAAYNVTQTGVIVGYIEPNTYHGSFSYRFYDPLSWWGIITDYDGDIRGVGEAEPYAWRYCVGYWPGAAAGRYVYRLSESEVLNDCISRTGDWYRPVGRDTGWQCFPEAVNGHGFFVGREVFGGYPDQASVGEFGHSTATLNSLLVPGMNIDLRSAVDIINDGRILANGYDATGQYRAFLLTPVPVRCPGDVNGDEYVDLLDLAQLLSHFGTATGADYAEGDLDEDGDVDLTDLATQLSSFGIACP